jgi:uncharacterized OB-fold protein
MTEKPGPRVSADTADFWEAANDGRFLLRECGNCGERRLYPRDACPNCWETEATDLDSEGTGTIVSFSIAHRPKDESFAVDVPYVVAIIELDDGPQLLSNIVDCAPDDVTIGADVQMVWTDRDGQQLYQFVLA